MTHKPILFFTDTITLWPHTARYGYNLDREISIREFCDGAPCSLVQVQETGEYIVRTADGNFIHGPEV